MLNSTSGEVADEYCFGFMPRTIVVLNSQTNNMNFVGDLNVFNAALASCTGIASIVALLNYMQPLGQVAATFLTRLLWRERSFLSSTSEETKKREHSFVSGVQLGRHGIMYYDRDGRDGDKYPAGGERVANKKGV